ncbi:MULTISPECIES: FKBP-type peptidyl-prolyl cis-trans isomerase [Pseudoalteromonas]|uniref:Peptidyl-prolyl cis-trans isomerase n=1 Tax=Pseudoalteromonas luteoviolacea H33 TaxID=1365251 RepID=A0A167G656_9GAMM|nr:MULTISPECIES: FKBP-type peptidyl-prolyl cis-trans isomerase [Pseudoalteromonas]MBQ4877437.1 FKBP-type peptidyl-prolyl cis-trans isomerase [Pseudoalteromonas luteoviolacea]KZN54156.1 peptidyl-prolyl cis-trans isomerase [Pseudoalteromonas luteoviolacea H33]KZN78313.1 peptidyl-prolyl cis-trans isomerase [Pseudoalteromonas luteoviolacea H33-S]MBQ4906464.1 FKBP-type peptidyl-prolyl cis-trans isomerase [Pseudoalteromonas luteoviolacea]MDK1287270.1 FKBP-type peptidyl-prolyl cis-trans isomerase [Ps
MSEQVIGPKSEVLFHYSIKLEDGSAADSTKVNNKPAKLFMGDGSLTENFESCLLGLKEGDNKTFELQPEDAFGMPNPDNIYYLDRTKFGADTPAEVGSIIAFTQPDGTELPGLIREVAGDSVTVDFNHPLAGQVVTFEVDILEVHS